MFKIICLFSISSFLIIGCSMYVPSHIGTSTSLQVSENNYEILSDKEVTGKASANIFLGIFNGNSGYRNAYKDALSQYPEANTLFNEKSDVKYFNFLNIFQSFTTEVTGYPAKIKIKKS